MSWCTDTWELRYDGSSGPNALAGTIQKQGSNLWKRAYFRVEDALFMNALLPTTGFAGIGNNFPGSLALATGLQSCRVTKLVAEVAPIKWTV